MVENTGWDGKAPVDDVLLFCDKWRSREDIAKEFGLTPAESWNCVKFVGKFRGVMVEHRQGKTRRAHMFKTRYHVIEDIRRKRSEAQDLKKASSN